jgi:hypothetical protein
MLQILVALALLLHGVGHVVGFVMPVPVWFSVLWLVPGAAFMVAAWGAWNQVTWWPGLVLGAAVLSIGVLILQRSAVQFGGPFGSAFVFDVVAIAALLLPWSRRLLVAGS